MAGPTMTAERKNRSGRIGVYQSESSLSVMRYSVPRLDWCNVESMMPAMMRSSGICLSLGMTPARMASSQERSATAVTRAQSRLSVIA